MRAWLAKRRLRNAMSQPLFLSFGSPIYRDVTTHGVRVYSLCGGCGARLQQSATLCDECAMTSGGTAKGEEGRV